MNELLSWHFSRARQFPPVPANASSTFFRIVGVALAAIVGGILGGAISVMTDGSINPLVFAAVIAAFMWARRHRDARQTRLVCFVATFLGWPAFNVLKAWMPQCD
ncbi:MAG: hypothetical protein KDA44_05425 [Planctomycetales bacterium]|nr:hypothetical protein [Planctomycetales bacterium]